MLRFRGRQKAVRGMTLRPGRLYFVSAIEANGFMGGYIRVEVSEGFGYCTMEYKGLENLMEDWELAGERMRRNG